MTAEFYQFIFLGLFVWVLCMYVCRGDQGRYVYQNRICAVFIKVEKLCSQ